MININPHVIYLQSVREVFLFFGSLYICSLPDFKWWGPCKCWWKTLICSEPARRLPLYMLNEIFQRNWWFISKENRHIDHNEYKHHVWNKPKHSSMPLWPLGRLSAGFWIVVTLIFMCPLYNFLATIFLETLPAGTDIRKYKVIIFEVKWNRYKRTWLN